MQITLPQVGESVVEGYINKWLVKPGQTVSKYDPLVEIITDKVSMDFPSPISGTISKILVQEGETVSAGTPIIDIKTLESNAEEEPRNIVERQHISRVGKLLKNVEPVGPTGSGRLKNNSQSSTTFYSPAVMRVAKTNNIDLNKIVGSGENGRITLKDLNDYVPDTIPTSSESDQNVPRTIEIVTTSSIRKIISRRMEKSAREIPHAWTMVEVDVSELMNLRTSTMDSFFHQEGIKLTYLPFVIQAVCAAIRENPILNSTWNAGEIWVNKQINIGIAVSTENGLFVPVIPNTNKLTISQIAKESDELISRAREGNLEIHEVQNGTFTINNTGALGSVLSAPLINHPQAAILTTERIIQRPVVIDNTIKARYIMNMCLSFDHRIMDGLEASNFLANIKHSLENISRDTNLN